MATLSVPVYLTGVHCSTSCPTMTNPAVAIALGLTAYNLSLVVAWNRGASPPSFLIS